MNDNTGKQPELEEAIEDEGIEMEAEITLDPLDEAQREIAELKDKYLRAVAEMQNNQRRARRDVEDAAKYGVASAARPLLEVADTLARALDSVPENADEALRNFVAGIEATQRALLQALEKMGVQPIAAAPGQQLNPHEHEVMFEVDSADIDHGAIVQVLEQGYKIHDRLLRPARVSVAKNAKSAPATPPEGSVDMSA